MSITQFPDGFIWGAASSAYQIEGSPLADGAGPSIQHTFAHTPGNIIAGTSPDGGTGDVGADHYNRYREDVGLMKELGLQAYEFSVAWSRVLPEGTGRVNQAGLDFYDKLVDALLEAGVSPAAWLYVWELPAALQDRGGWANRDCAEWFAEYSGVVFERLGDRVKHWFTICEPQSASHYGYIAGELAPAQRDLYAGLRALHHLLLGQGRAVEAFRASGATGEIGNCHALADILPASDSEADQAAAERANAYVNTLHLDAILGGEYPAEMVEFFGAAWPEVKDGDMATISAPMDFFGISSYSHSIVADGFVEDEGGAADIGAAGPLGPALARLLDVSVVPPSKPLTDLGWEIVPESLTRTLKWVRDRYDNPPMIISEMGASYDDVVTEDGKVHDPQRIEWLRDYLLAAHDAISDGVDLRGIFIWAFLDTWEFNLGYSCRFGLVHVDYETKRRTIKDSGYWYRDVMAANAVETS